MNLGETTSEWEDPPIPQRSIDAPDIWKKASFRFKLKKLFSSDIVNGTDDYKRVYTEYMVWAKMIADIGDGGDGGLGGIGGYAGSVHAIGLEHTPKFQIFDETGN